MGSAFNIGKIFGIRFRLHYTWFIIFVLVTVSLSWQVFPVLYPGWTGLPGGAAARHDIDRTARGFLNRSRPTRTQFVDQVHIHAVVGMAET